MMPLSQQTEHPLVDQEIEGVALLGQMQSGKSATVADFLATNTTTSPFYLVDPIGTQANVADQHDLPTYDYASLKQFKTDPTSQAYFNLASLDKTNTPQEAYQEVINAVIEKGVTDGVVCLEESHVLRDDLPQTMARLQEAGHTPVITAHGPADLTTPASNNQQLIGALSHVLIFTLPTLKPEYQDRFGITSDMQVERIFDPSPAADPVLVEL